MIGLNTYSVVASFLVGTTFEMLLLGICLMQTIRYFDNFGNSDSRWYRSAVWLLIVLAFAQAMCQCGTIWSLGITALLNPDPRALNFIPWTFRFAPLFSAVAASTVQFFYAYRVYLIAKRSWILALPIVLLSLGNFIIATYTTGYAFAHPHFSSLAALKPEADAAIYLLVATDAIISSAMVYHLQKAKTDMADTNSVISRIIVIILTCNLLTTSVVITAAVLVPLSGPWNLIPGICVPGCYQLSLLASLNQRVAIKDQLRNKKRRAPNTPFNTSQHHRYSAGADSVELTAAEKTNPQNRLTIRGSAYGAPETSKSYHVVDFHMEPKKQTSVRDLEADTELSSTLTLEAQSVSDDREEGPRTSVQSLEEMVDNLDALLASPPAPTPSHRSALQELSGESPTFASPIGSSPPDSPPQSLPAPLTMPDFTPSSSQAREPNHIEVLSPEIIPLPSSPEMTETNPSTPMIPTVFSTPTLTTPPAFEFSDPNTPVVQSPTPEAAMREVTPGITRVLSQSQLLSAPTSPLQPSATPIILLTPEPSEPGSRSATPIANSGSATPLTTAQLALCFQPSPSVLSVLGKNNAEDTAEEETREEGEEEEEEGSPKRAIPSYRISADPFTRRPKPVHRISL